ncbi:MAG TPA: cytochrome b/b6 domain-containing protein [Burkholderiales bacterium]|nr:cytochrome b/b6 domain-containing protein [Burkholderiales bacterium]
MSETGDSRGMALVRVWDAPVRLFHWLLVALVAFMFVSGKLDWMTWHMRCGYTVLALVLFRVLWGFVGSSTARFSSFLAGPSAVLGFARRLLSRGDASTPGHNPLGGWMVLLLLAVLLTQAGTGLFANDDVLSEGPLAALVRKDTSDQLSTIHYWNSYLLLLLVALHVIAVAYHWLVKKENLVGAMFTGAKRVPAAAAAESAATRFASPWRALALLGVAALAVYLIVNRPF